MRKKLPPLNALRSFEAAARHTSFKDAANELCVSHSAISHQVKLLEEHLGVELFTRKARAVELTRAGQAYYPVLRDAFEQILEATRRVMAPRAADVFTLQVYSTLAIRWLIPRLPLFHAAFPDIQIRLNTAQSDVDFASDDVDACIMIGKAVDDKLHYRYLFSSELFPVCSPDLLAQGEGINTPEGLVKHTILQVHPSPKDWNIWLRAHALENLDPNTGLMFDSYDHALVTAAQGLGVAMGTQPYTSRELAQGTLVEIFDGGRVSHEDDWFFVCREGKQEHRKIRLFGDWLEQQIASDEDGFALETPRANQGTGEPG